MTGAHSFKAGMDLNGATRWADTSSVVPYSYVVSTLANNGVGLGIPVPTTLTLRSDGCTDPLVRQVNGGIVGGHTSIQPYCPTPAKNKVSSEGGIYVQDKWTIDRVTLSMGLRYDWFNSSNPEYHLGPSLLTPNRNYDVPGLRYDALQGLDAQSRRGLGRVRRRQDGDQGQLREVRPRSGAGRRRPRQPAGLQRPAHVVSDVDRQRQGLRSGLRSDAQSRPRVRRRSASIDRSTRATPPSAANPTSTSNTLIPNLAVQDDARYGWGKRPYSWEFSLSGQQELSQGVAVYGGVFWRWFGNFLVTDNTTGTAADYTPFSVTPGLIPPSPASAGGESLPSDINTGTFYNINPGVAVNNLQGLSKTMFPGSNVYDHWFGYDVGLNARLPQGIIFQGGLSTGHQTTDFCDVQDPAKAGNNALVEMLTVAGTASSLASCHMEQNWLPQIKFLGSYTIPKIDVQVGASFQSIPGVEYSATYAAPNTDLARPVAQGGLGRLPAGGTATQTTNVALIQPGSLYGPRFNQIDARFGKVLRMGRTRAVVSLDLFNVLNSDTISSASAVYATWLAPAAVVAPRLMKVSLTYDF